MARNDGNSPRIEVAKERWLKVSGKHHAVVNGTAVVIKPGDVVEFDLGHGPVGDNQWKMLDGPTQEQRQELAKGKKPLKAVHKGGGKWNVEQEDGTVINKSYLTKAQAAAMVADALD